MSRLLPLSANIVQTNRRGQVFCVCSVPDTSAALRGGEKNDRRGVVKNLALRNLARSSPVSFCALCAKFFFVAHFAHILRTLRTILRTLRFRAVLDAQTLRRPRAPYAAREPSANRRERAQPDAFCLNYGYLRQTTSGPDVEDLASRKTWRAMATTARAALPHRGGVARSTSARPPFVASARRDCRTHTSVAVRFKALSRAGTPPPCKSRRDVSASRQVGVVSVDSC